MHHSQPGIQVYIEKKRGEREKEKGNEHLYSYFLMFVNSSERRDQGGGMSAEKKRTTTNGKKDSQQGHQMSVFNIDSIFSSSVRYPERYVLKPEIIICRFQDISKKKQRGGTDRMFSSCLLRDYFKKFRHFCENQTISNETNAKMFSLPY